MNKNMPKKIPYSFFAILFGGLLISIGLSWVVFATPPPSAKPLSTGLSATPVPGFTTIQTKSTEQSVIEAGKPAPDFILKNLDGKEIHLSDFAGKPVMINLWASWCIPCQDEMPEIEKIYENYKTSGLVVLGINLTFQDHIQDVRDAINKYQITYPILLDETGQMSGLYHMYGIPTSYFIDSKGILRRIQIGEILPNYISSYFLEIIPRK